MQKLKNTKKSSRKSRDEEGQKKTHLNKDSLKERPISSSHPDIMAAAKDALKNIRDQEKAYVGCPEMPYDEIIASRICAVIASSYDMSVIDIIKQYYPLFPSYDTIIRWRYTVPQFTLMYARAIAERANLLAEHGIELIESELIRYEDEKGIRRVDAGSVQAARLKSDYTKWMAARLCKPIWDEVDKVEDMVDKLQEKTEKLLAVQAQLKGEFDKDY